jgi:hypothetical protein
MKRMTMTLEQLCRAMLPADIRFKTPQGHLHSSWEKPRQLTWVGHALRRNKGGPMRTFALFNPAHRKKKRGGPETCHLQYITMLLETRGMEARTVTEIEALAQDRKIWHKITKKLPCA